MTMRPRFPLAGLATVITASSLLTLQAQQSANITVQANQVLAPVNRLIFGQNIDAADNAYIFSSNTTDPNLIQRGDGIWDPATNEPVPDILSKSKAIGMSMLRYPGGCLTHNYDWRKTVGPDAKKNGWLFGLDEYLSLCSSIGAVPLITISDYVLPGDQMPENAAALVEYLNSPADASHPWAMKRKQWGHPAPYNVKWFELGNESMHGNHRVTPHRQYTAEQYAAYANATAAAMRRVDPRIKLGIVTVPGAGTDVNSDWNRTILHLAGPSADFVVLHFYVPNEPKTGVPENVLMQAMMVAPQHIEERLMQYHQLIRQQVGHDLPLAITEFNGQIDQSGKAYRFSFGTALECADLLRVFLEPQSNVAFANYFNFINGYYGMVRAPEGPADKTQPSVEPAFQLYELWAQHFGSRLVKLDVDSPRGGFAGAGSEPASSGNTAEPKRSLGPIDVGQYSSLVGSMWPKLLNVDIQRHDSDFTIHMQNLNQSIFPLLARIPRPNVDPNIPVELTVEFDAKFTPDPGSNVAQMGIGLIDSRGWAQTHSGIGLDDITTTMKHFSGTYQLNSQTPSVDLSARLIAGGKNVTGTLEVHNLVLTAAVSAHDVAYPLLTSSASISPDGRKLYLIVFNKSDSASIPTAIHLASFRAAKAEYWEVNGPALAALNGVTETQQAAPVTLSGASEASHVFPAHSMTAIEFSEGR